MKREEDLLERWKFFGGKERIEYFPIYTVQLFLILALHINPNLLNTWRDPTNQSQ